MVRESVGERWPLSHLSPTLSLSTFLKRTSRVAMGNLLAPTRLHRADRKANPEHVPGGEKDAKRRETSRVDDAHLLRRNLHHRQGPRRDPAPAATSDALLSRRFADLLGSSLASAEAQPECASDLRDRNDRSFANLDWLTENCPYAGRRRRRFDLSEQLFDVHRYLLLVIPKIYPWWELRGYGSCAPHTIHTHVAPTMELLWAAPRPSLVPLYRFERGQSSANLTGICSELRREVDG